MLGTIILCLMLVLWFLAVSAGFSGLVHLLLAAPMFAFAVALFDGLLGSCTIVEKPD